MDTISQPDAFSVWREERESDLNRWSENSTTPENIASALDKITNAGNAERALAGSHEGREILELLQNARDAISNGDTTAGRVYVGVFESGVLVANTGEPFDLLDDEIMNTVRKVGESKKSGDSIGHKGVGLNSVLSVGDAFEVWSRLESLDEPLRVRYSRTYLTAALAQRMGHDLSVEELCRTIHPDALVEASDGTRQLTKTVDRTTPVALPDDVGKLPLFWYPWPLRPDVDSSPVATRAYDLLTAPHECLAQFDTPPTDPFRTAVFIDYEDATWRDLLDQLDVAAPDEDEVNIDPDEQASLLWQYLSETHDRSTSLRPETVIQLGEIEDLYLERIDETGHTTAAEHWSVDREADTELVPTEGVEYEEVEITISHATQTPEDSLSQLFDRFWRTDCPETEPSLLVPRLQREAHPADDDQPTPERLRSEYPLYLFYPINRTDRHSLPFCLHGRFLVSTDRQDLSQSAKSHNLNVLTDGADLVEDVATATAALGAEDPSRWDIYPWVLLPPNTEESPADPASTVELMEWLCTAIYDRLQNTPCLPSEGRDQHRPEDTTIHPAADVIEGFVAGHKLEVDRETRSHSTSLPPLAHLQELVQLLSNRPIWRQRLERLVLHGDEWPAFTERILESWTQHLQEALAGGADDSIARDVSKQQAHALFRGTTALIRERAEQVDGSDEILKQYADDLDGVYLLPCEKAGSQDHSLLVQIEYRDTPGAGRSARTVVWGRAEELQSDDFPPKHGQFDVYFLEKSIQEPVQGILSNAGDYWGMRQSDGFAELYRSLLGTFGTDRRMQLDSGSLGALATLIPKINESRATSLQTDEASFFSAEYAKNAPEPSKRERRRQINTRLRLRHVTLEALDDTPLADLTFPTSWQYQRALARHEDEDAGENAEPDVAADWTDAADLSGPTLPPPADSVWDAVPVTDTVPSKSRRLARLLSLLGICGLPGLRVLWMYGPEHPQIQSSSQPHWNPLEWTQSNGQRADLRRTIERNEDYLTWLTSASNHPSQSASHAYSCDKRPVSEHGGSGSNLVGWIWFDTDQLDRLTATPSALIETLGRHSKQYRTTVLTTNWFCKSYQTCDPSHNLPTLANWQLRQLPIWDSILDVGSSVAEYWAEDGNRLAWAVREGGTSGAQGWRLFPTVDPEDTPISESLLETLGVSALDELSVSEAEYRLQKLQSVLADDLHSSRRSQLDIPPERKRDWGRAYSLLLQPIMRYVGREEITDIDELREHFSYLTHIPLRRIHSEGDEWVAAPLSWLSEHAAAVRRYPEESPTPWEQNRVRDNEWDLLDFPQIQTGFADFASALGVDKVEASKPVPSVDDDDFNLVDARRERLDLATDRKALRRRQTILLASIGTTDDERIVEEAEKLETAIDNLAVAESFPPRVANQLSDPRSGLYRTSDGEIGLVYNGAEAGSLDRDALAMGLALLFEQYRNVSIFETALDPTQSRSVLRERWRKETFPIQAVQTAIEDHTRRNVRKKLSAGRDLLLSTGTEEKDLPTVEELMEEFDAEDVTAEETRILADIGGAIQTDCPPSASLPPHLEAYLEVCRRCSEWIQAFLTKLLGANETAISWRSLVSDTVPETHQPAVIEWIVTHESLLDESIVTDEFVPTARRVLAVYRAWGRTTDPESQLESPTAWRAAVRDQHRTTDLQLADRLPSRLRKIANVAEEQRWFSYQDETELLTEVATPLLDFLSLTVEIDPPTQEMLSEFVSSGEFGLETDEGTRHDHKSRAYAEAEDAIMNARTSDFSQFDRTDQSTFGGGSSDDSGARVVVNQGNGTGGGSSQLRGRGEQAEVAVGLDLLQSLRTWLYDDGARYNEFVEIFRTLSENQQTEDYRWHTQTEWEDTLTPLLEQPWSAVQRDFTGYRDLLSEGTHLDDLMPLKLLDVSGENGPGFDIIDPFGTYQDRNGEPADWSLQPIPVEIKAVSGRSPPFAFRFTTNEFRQAKRFTAGGQRYAIRFIDVPDPETDDWLPKTTCVSERVFSSPDELDQMIEGQPFEDAIKGGYMNISVGRNPPNDS